MNPYELTLLIMAVLVMAVSSKLPRAWLWIGAGIASATASAMYWNVGGPYHPVFTFFCDSIVCLLIYAGARERWELKIYFLFKTSVFVSVVYFASTHLLKLQVPPVLYASLLELVNALALLTIGGTAIVDRIRANGDYYGHRWFADLRRTGSSLRAARQTHPWHRVEK